MRKPSKAHQERLAALLKQLHDNEVARANPLTQVEELEAHTKATQIEYNTLYNATAAIASLPDEILGLVFETGTNSSNPLFYFQLLLSRVTAHWRKVAFSTPKLWFDIRITHWDELELDRISAYLRRSKAVTIAIWIGATYETLTDERIAKLMHIITPHFSRCHLLAVDSISDAGFMRILSSFSSASFPLLHSLRLVNDDDNNINTLLIGCSPSLTSMYLVGLTAITTPLKSVTALFLECSFFLPHHFTMFQHFLSSLPSLAHLELILSTHCNWPSDLRFIGLSALQELEVSFIEDNRGHPWKLLAALRAPSLHTLALDLHCEPDLRSMLSPTIFPSLRRLAVRCPRVDSASMTIIRQIAQSFPQILNLIYTSQAPQHCFKILEEQDSWPHMQNLMFPRTDIPAVLIRDLLAKRTYLGHPLRSVALSEETFKALSADERDGLGQYARIEEYVDDWQDHFLAMR